MRLKNTVLLRGDDVTAYRDPAAIWHEGVFHLYFTYVDNRPGGPWMYLGESTSADLVNWSEVRLLTPPDKSRNFSSPGNIVRDGEDWVLCLQTYCRENGEKYGNENSRLYTMRSKDLTVWTEPELLRVKGDVPDEEMGRMIDPFLIRRDDEWWCFFKQNGSVNFSRSKDLRRWEYVGQTDEGENACVVPMGNKFRLFSSPGKNGIHVMDSEDLIHWRQAMDDLTLGQKDWDWAQGRVTAGFVMENTALPEFPRYLMFFHGSRYSEQIDFDGNASIGIAFSDDLDNWYWPED